MKSFMILLFAAFISFQIKVAKSSPLVLIGGVTEIETPTTLETLRNIRQAVIYQEYKYYTVPDFTEIDPSIPDSARLAAQISNPGIFPYTPRTERVFNPGDSFSSYILRLPGNFEIRQAIGSVIFPGKILGISWNFRHDDVIDTLYSVGFPRIDSVNDGLELDWPQCQEVIDFTGTVCDRFVLLPDLNFLAFEFNSTEFSDTIRIFVSVNEPSTLFLSAMLMMIMLFVVNVRGFS